MKKSHAFSVYTPVDFNNEQTWLSIFTYLEPGDIIQYYRTVQNTFHSQAVHRTSYENGEFKVSVGQHTSNEWKNLREYARNQQSGTLICVLKVKGPTPMRSPSLELSDKDNWKLSMMLEAEQDLVTTNTIQEDEKWAKVNALKKALVDRALQNPSDTKREITKERLVEAIENRLDGNYAMLRASDNMGNPPSLLEEDNLLHAENEILTGYLEDLEREDVNIGDMWNEYWYEIVGRAPPAEYETYEEAG